MKVTRATSSKTDSFYLKKLGAKLLSGLHAISKVYNAITVVTSTQGC
jgi:hypothetical protein